MALGTTLVNLAEGFVQRHRQQISAASSNVHPSTAPGHGSVAAHASAAPDGGAAAQAATRLRKEMAVSEPGADASRRAAATLGRHSAFVDSCLPDVDESDSDEEDRVIVDDSPDDDDGGGGDDDDDDETLVEDSDTHLNMHAVEIGFDEIGSQSVDSLSSTVHLDSRLGSPNDDIAARHGAKQVSSAPGAACSIRSLVCGGVGACCVCRSTKPWRSLRRPTPTPTPTPTRMATQTRASGR